MTSVILNVEIADDQVVVFVNSAQVASITNANKGRQDLTAYLRTGSNEILVTGINTEGNGHYKGYIQINDNEKAFDQTTNEGGLTWSQKYEVTVG